MPVIQLNAIPGYEMVPLLEALNGPYHPSDLSAATASLARDAARALNPAEDVSDTRPIAMTVMVAPSPHSNDTDTGKSDDEKTRSSESPITVISELPRKTSSTKLSKSSSADAKTPVTSDPEDEHHFSEAVETLPDLQEFTSRMESSLSNHKYDDKSFNGNYAKDEEEMQLQSIESSPTNTNNMLLIAAIDEFSDEEDTSRAKGINV